MTIFGDRVATPADATAAGWIAPRLGRFGTVGGLVPTGFERYVLVRHLSPEAEECPEDGVELIAALASVAKRHTTTPGLAWYATWEGYGWVGAATLYAVRERGPLTRLVRTRERRRRLDADRRRDKEVRQGLAEVPQFDLPNRRYYLLSGALDSASRIASPDGCGLQAPDLWWPEDHSWFVAGDTDLDWTYVAGAESLVADIASAFPDRTEPVQLSAANASFSQRS